MYFNRIAIEKHFDFHRLILMWKVFLKRAMHRIVQHHRIKLHSLTLIFKRIECTRPNRLHVPIPQEALSKHGCLPTIIFELCRFMAKTTHIKVILWQRMMNMRVMQSYKFSLVKDKLSFVSEVAQVG